MNYRNFFFLFSPKDRPEITRFLSLASKPNRLIVDTESVCAGTSLAQEPPTTTKLRNSTSRTRKVKKKSKPVPRPARTSIFLPRSSHRLMPPSARRQPKSSNEPIHNQRPSRCHTNMRSRFPRTAHCPILRTLFYPTYHTSNQHHSISPFSASHSPKQ
jgi:hypothetical protein